MIGVLWLVALDQSRLLGPPGFGRLQAAATLIAVLLAAVGAAWWRRSGGSLPRLSVHLLIALLFIGGPVLAIGSAAGRERGVDLRHNHTVGLSRLRGAVWSQAGLQDTRVCRCSPNERHRIRLPGGFETDAVVYTPSDRIAGRRFPAVLVVHGNVWNGSDASTYRVMADALRRRGYLVVLFDIIGFGRSEDPYAHGPAGIAYAFDRPEQVRAVLEWLVARPDVDPEDVTLLGHSMGADLATRVGTHDARVARIANMVAPEPRADREATDGGAVRRAYFAERERDQHRYIYGRDVPEWFRPEMVPAMDDVMAAGRERLGVPGHPPFLLILGERDEPSGHDQELQALARMTPPADLLRLPGSDHYLNSAQSVGLVFYDRKVARAFGDGMLKWMKGS